MRKIFVGNNKSSFKDFTEKPQIQWALRVYALLFPVLAFFLLEGLNPVSPTFLAGGVVFASILFIYLASVVLFAATGSVFWAYFIVSLLLGIGFIVNHFKIMLIGQVLVPTDFLLVGEAVGAADLSAITIERTLLLQVFLIALTHAPLWFLRFKMPIKLRGIAAGGAFAVFFVVYFFSATSAPIMAGLGMPRGSGSQTVLYSETGLIMGFHTSILYQQAHNARMAEFATEAEVFLANTPRVQNRTDVQPNVIVIMSESFMDPTILDNVHFSTNPVSNFHRLANQGISGDNIVPVFGGGTANTEMEFLTGAPVFFLSSAYAVPYSNPSRYFSQNLYTAMPWLFQENGYRTVALHPNYASFYNRNFVYPRLGFQEFIAKEQMPDADFKGWYISDEYFTNRMIQEIERAEQDNTPLFLFGISIQNHFEFWGSKYQDFDTDIYATSPVLTESQVGSVSTFAQGVFDADKQLGRLIDFIEAGDTPTMVVFFGDHLPVLGYHFDNIFERLGFVSSQAVHTWNMEDRSRMFAPPYLVWDNFSNNLEEWGTISTYFLGANVLAHSGIALNRHWEHVLHFNHHFRALTENHYVDIYGNFRYIYSVWEKPHVNAFAGLVHNKWFGEDEIRQNLADIAD